MNIKRNALNTKEKNKNPITVNFSSTVVPNNLLTGLIPLCASLGHDGKVTLAGHVGANVCAASGLGHFGLVVESPLVPERKKVSRWKLVVGSSIGAAVGAFLLSLLLIALFVKVKKRARMEEPERRAYEEEALQVTMVALQVTMVGHVRAPTAPVSRTVPAIDHEYRPPPS